MEPGLEIFDTVISTEVCYHDVAPDILTEFHPWMRSAFFAADAKLTDMSKSAVGKLALPGKVVWGRMATGESFITDESRQKINDEFAPLTVDMETASIAHVCYANAIPFIAVRCVTDTEKHSGIDNFEENCAKASSIAKDITVALLRGQEAAIRSKEIENGGSMALTVQGRLKGPRVGPGFEPGKVHSLSCRGSWAKNRTRKGTLVTKVSASARGWAICTPRSPMTIGSTSISGR